VAAVAVGGGAMAADAVVGRLAAERSRSQVGVAMVFCGKEEDEVRFRSHV